MSTIFDRLIDKIQARRQSKLAAKKAEYNEIIASEKYECTDTSLFASLKAVKGLGSCEVKAAEQVAKICQHKMAEAGKSTLSRAVYNNACKQVVAFGTDGADDAMFENQKMVNSILVASWKHGDEVGGFYGYKGERLQQFKKMFKQNNDKSVKQPVREAGIER